MSDGTLGLRDILEQWDSAVQLGTAQHLLIVSDACESGKMVNEAELLDQKDIAVQASCAGCNNSLDTVGETFTEYLLWNLQGRSTANKRGTDMLIHIERALLEFRPSYYCPDKRNYRGWVFIDEADGADYSSSQGLSLGPETSDASTLSFHFGGHDDNMSNQEANPLGLEDAPLADNDEQVGSELFAFLIFVALCWLLFFATLKNCNLAFLFIDGICYSHSVFDKV